MRASRRLAGVAALAAAALWLGGCGSSPPPVADPAPAVDRPAAPPMPAARDTRTPIEQRRDTACDQLGPRLTACAVEDARNKLAAGQIDQRQFDLDTAPAVQRKNTEEFEAVCKHARYSSRQVRVLEVCFIAETQCLPLLACLEHLRDRPPAGGK